MIDLTFDSADSKEEVYFSWWLNELFDAGYVLDWGYQSKTFSLSDKIIYQTKKQLKTKVKIEDRTLLQPHTYTTDFVIKWHPLGQGLFYEDITSGTDLKQYPFISHGGISYVDVKPVFFRRGDSFMKMFSVRQKWVWQRYKIYIQPIIVTGKKTALFESTFCPSRFLLTDKARAKRKLKFSPVMLKNMIG